MSMKSAVLALAVCAALAACKKDEAPAPEAPAAAAEATTEAAPAPEAASEATAATAAPAVTTFDINTIAVSDKPLPDWPYVALPAGYHYDNEETAAQSKDLARVPVWTGGQLLWVEGKTFTDRISNDEGKTFSKFEVRKNLQQDIKALGGVRLSDRSVEEAAEKANQKELEDFRVEFSQISEAYYAGYDADTYVIRRADKAIWVVTSVKDGRAGVMVAEGPLPEAPAKQ